MLGRRRVAPALAVGAVLLGLAGIASAQDARDALEGTYSLRAGSEPVRLTVTRAPDGGPYGVRRQAGTAVQSGVGVVTSAGFSVRLTRVREVGLVDGLRGGAARDATPDVTTGDYVVRADGSISGALQAGGKSWREEGTRDAAAPPKATADAAPVATAATAVKLGPGGLPLDLAEAIFGFPSGMKAAAVAPRAPGVRIATAGRDYEGVVIEVGKDFESYREALVRDPVRLQRLYDLGFDWVRVSDGYREVDYELANASRPKHEVREVFNTGLLQEAAYALAYQAGRMGAARRAAYEAHESRGTCLEVSGSQDRGLTLGIRLYNSQVGVGKNYVETFKKVPGVVKAMRGYGFTEVMLDETWVFRVR